MMAAVRIGVAALVAGVAIAQMAPVPGWFLAGSNREGFELTLDSEARHGGDLSARLKCRDISCSGFGTVMQSVRAAHYLDKRIRLSAWVKAEKRVRARLWMRIDAVDGRTLAFDNMQYRARSGPFDWTHQEVVLQVPRDSALINFGLIVEGAGSAWLDDVTLEVVPRNVRTTNLIDPGATSRSAPSVADSYYKATYEPVNLDFDSPPTPSPGR
jgi:hypothetical protein